MKCKKKPLDFRKEFLWKQMEELQNLREQSIQTMGGVHNAYLTLLPIIFAAIGPVLGLGKEIIFTRIFWIIMIFSGFTSFIFGMATYKKQILTHINQVYYTKRINLTRKYLTFFDPDIENLALLPLDDIEPKFGKISVLKKNAFWISDFLILNLIDSLILSTTVMVVCWLIINSKQLQSINFIIRKHYFYEFPPTSLCWMSVIIGVGIVFGLISFVCHFCCMKKLNKEANKKFLQS